MARTISDFVNPQFAPLPECDGLTTAAARLTHVEEQKKLYLRIQRVPLKCNNSLMRMLYYRSHHILAQCSSSASIDVKVLLKKHISACRHQVVVVLYVLRTLNFSYAWLNSTLFQQLPLGVP